MTSGLRTKHFHSATIGLGLILASACGRIYEGKVHVDPVAVGNQDQTPSVDFSTPAATDLNEIELACEIVDGVYEQNCAYAEIGALAHENLIAFPDFASLGADGRRTLDKRFLTLVYDVEGVSESNDEKWLAPEKIIFSSKAIKATQKENPSRVFPGDVYLSNAPLWEKTLSNELRYDLFQMFAKPGDVEVTPKLMKNWNFGQCSGDPQDVEPDVFESCDGGETGEPENAFKGMIARAAFYGSVMYDIAIEENRLEVFRSWHKAFPVSNWELERAKKIQAIQGNMNPFVVSPDLVEKTPFKIKN